MKKLNTWRRIQAAVDKREYRKLGELGTIIEAFDLVGIPYDVSTVSEVSGDAYIDDGGNLITKKTRLVWVRISIPPSNGESLASVFRFDSSFRFDSVYVESAVALGYRAGTEEDEDDVSFFMYGPPDID